MAGNQALLGLPANDNGFRPVERETIANDLCSNPRKVWRKRCGGDGVKPGRDDVAIKVPSGENQGTPILQGSVTAPGLQAPPDYSIGGFILPKNSFVGDDSVYGGGIAPASRKGGSIFAAGLGYDAPPVDVVDGPILLGGSPDPVKGGAIRGPLPKITVDPNPGPSPDPANPPHLPPEIMPPGITPAPGDDGLGRVADIFGKLYGSGIATTPQAPVNDGGPVLLYPVNQNSPAPAPAPAMNVSPMIWIALVAALAVGAFLYYRSKHHG